MIEQSHNPDAMKAMLDYKPKPKQIEGVKYEPVKCEVSAAGSGYGNSKAAQRLAARRRAAPINTQCFQISNAFDPNNEKGTNWTEKVKKEIVQRVANFGDVVHVHVDKNSLNGQAYVKCASGKIFLKILEGFHFLDWTPFFRKVRTSVQSLTP